MRLLDQETDNKLNQVTIFLTKSEAKEMIDSLQELISNPGENHQHVSSEDFQKEITICIYDQNSLNGFSDRAKMLILEDI